jgi:hypothetical protein
MANPFFMALLLSLGFEIGQSSVLFYILMAKEKQKLPWIIMIILTIVQITGNIYSSFRYIDISGTNNWSYFQRSMLFSVQVDGPEMYKVIIAWISGAILPIVCLCLTALIAHIIQSRDDQKKEPEIVEPVSDKKPTKDTPVTKVEDDVTRVTDDEETDFLTTFDANEAPLTSEPTSEPTIDPNLVIQRDPVLIKEGRETPSKSDEIKTKTKKVLKVPKTLKKALGRLRTGKLAVL